MNFKDLVNNCPICKGTGYVDCITCSCMASYRTLLYLLDFGFEEDMLEMIHKDYDYPFIESGENFVNYFDKNPEVVEKKGLSLFLYSQERGRGKTTLAHYLSYSYLNYYFQHMNRYSRDRELGFNYVDDLLEEFDSNDWWKRRFYVLDDLGKEDSSAVWKKEANISKLHRILQYRRNKKLVTIITSNYPPSEISRKYDGQLDSLLEIQLDGSLGGGIFKSVKVGGPEDLRLNRDVWEID